MIVQKKVTDIDVIEAALSVLVSIAETDQVRSIIIDLGVLPTIVKMAEDKVLKFKMEVHKHFLT